MLSEISYIFNWWLVFFILGVSSIPISFLLFKHHIDKGYSFSKIIGLIIPSYIIFLGSIFKIFRLSNLFVYVIFSIYILFNSYLLQKHSKTILSSLRENIRAIAIGEILFSAGYLLWSMIRGYQPDINGLEKFMDLGFINSILRSDYLPPADMWAAGETINYYWFGHYLTAIATKISGIPSHIAYNLMLATILGLALASTYSITASLITFINKRFDTKKAILCGIISAVMLSFAGNFHTPIYLLKEGADNYWYPDATRFIGYHPETNDKTIHEFPIYSFVVSDLHAHLINLPIVLLYIALLLRFLKKLNSDKKTSITELLPNGALIGIMFMTSAWDFANYSLLTGIGLLFFNFKKYKFSLNTVIETAKFVFIYLLSAIIVVLPFMLNFESIAEGIKFVNARTPLWQLGVLWGFPALITIIFMLLLKRIKKLNFSDLFILSLMITGWFLIILPEIVYVKDIYIASHHRANTMFKLTYQAFVMFYLSSGYVLYRTVQVIKEKENKAVALLFLSLVLVSLLIYPYHAVKSYYGDLKTYHGLSGETWMQRRYPGYYETVQWFRDNIVDQPVILEAQGDSYTDYNMVSAYTGLPTVNGWYVHEWLWRGTSDFPQKRANDIAQIYNTSSTGEAKHILDKYQVEYVIIGPLEHEKYTSINSDKFLSLGRQVFQSGSVSVYQINR